MITGDSLLTSLHVAKKVHICNTSLPILTLSLCKDIPSSVVDDTDNNNDNNNDNTKNSLKLKTKSYTIENFTWSIYDEVHNHEIENYLPLNLDTTTTTSSSTRIDDENSIVKLVMKYNLVTTEEIFLLAINATGGKTSKLWTFAGWRMIVSADCLITV